MTEQIINFVKITKKSTPDVKIVSSKHWPLTAMANSEIELRMEKKGNTGNQNNNDRDEMRKSSQFLFNFWKLSACKNQ